MVENRKGTVKGSDPVKDEEPSDSSILDTSHDSEPLDTDLLRRKNEFQHNTSIISEESEGFSDPPLLDSLAVEKPRCITPVPFTPSLPVTPQNMFRPVEHPLVQSTGPAPITEFSGAYAPKQQDSLFWCVFILAYGYGEYINVGRNYGVKELEIKQKIGAFVANRGYQKNSPNYKITHALRDEIHSELLTSQKETSFPCLVMLCCYYNINLVLVHPKGKLMLEFTSGNGEDVPYYVIQKDSFGKYKVDTDKKTWKDVQEMKSRLICLDNYMKPLKAVGHYKMEDLEMLAYKLGVLDESKKYKKTELYHLVGGTMNWFL
jgi:hypothetical protein